MIFFVFWILGVFGGVISTVLNPALRTVGSVCENLLLWQLAGTLAVSGATGFIGHVFRSDMVADSIGWPKGSPFQKELGYSELGYALAGLLCIWFRGDFWLAVIVLTAPLYLLAGANHVRDVVKEKNYAPHSTGTILPDFIMPLSWIVLYILMRV